MLLNDGLTGRLEVMSDADIYSSALRLFQDFNPEQNLRLLENLGRTNISQGIISDDVDQTIHNLTSIGREAMNETDRLVLKIMTSK